MYLNCVLSSGRVRSQCGDHAHGAHPRQPQDHRSRLERTGVALRPATRRHQRPLLHGPPGSAVRVQWPPNLAQPVPHLRPVAQGHGLLLNFNQFLSFL